MAVRAPRGPDLVRLRVVNITKLSCAVRGHGIAAATVSVICSRPEWVQSEYTRHGRTETSSCAILECLSFPRASTKVVRGRRSG